MFCLCPRASGSVLGLCLRGIDIQTVVVHDGSVLL